MCGTKVYVKPGDIVFQKLPWSEVCMHMRVAGKAMPVRILEDRGGCSAQPMNQHGQPFCAPVLMGEAGFYHDAGGWYSHEIRAANLAFDVAASPGRL